jgi:adenosylmethionine-8-amino-7-oxononanoate aminotransferase
VTLAARERGAIIRPLGDVVVLMPALVISKADLQRLVAITTASIRAAHDSAYGSGAAREAFAEHALTEIPKAA